MSQTEQEALEAGTVWWDGELFSGKPDWEKLLAHPRAAAHAPRSRRSSTARSRSCARCSTTGRSRTSTRTCRRDVWQFIKEKGFLGMIIPKEYGGLGFSRATRTPQVVHEALDALEHRGGHGDGAELARARRAAAALRHRRAEEPLPAAPRARAWRSRASRSPAPRRAPTRRRFPTTASSARAMHEGKRVLGMRVTWDKRYITLRPDRDAARPRVPRSTIPTSCSATRRTSASPAR